MVKLGNLAAKAVSDFKKKKKEFPYLSILEKFPASTKKARSDCGNICQARPVSLPITLQFSEPVWLPYMEYWFGEDERFFFFIKAFF